MRVLPCLPSFGTATCAAAKITSLCMSAHAVLLMPWLVHMFKHAMSLRFRLCRALGIKESSTPQRPLDVCTLSNVSAGRRMQRHSCARL